MIDHLQSRTHKPILLLFHSTCPAGRETMSRSYLCAGQLQLTSMDCGTLDRETRQLQSTSVQERHAANRAKGQVWYGNLQTLRDMTDIGHGEPQPSTAAEVIFWNFQSWEAGPCSPYGVGVVSCRSGTVCTAWWVCTCCASHTRHEYRRLHNSFHPSRFPAIDLVLPASPFNLSLCIVDVALAQ